MRAEVCATAPAEWKTTPIESVCKLITSGGTPSRRNSAYYSDGGWPWVKTQELKDGWIDDTEEHITDEAIAESASKVLPAKTVLIALYGATVGKLGLIRRPMTCNQACCAMVVSPDKADERYLFYQLLYHRKQLKSQAVGAAQQNLSGLFFRSFELPFPSIPEQRAIASVLGSLDDKIELSRRMNRTLEQVARALFESWFVDFDPVRAKADGRWKRGESLPGMPADMWGLWPSEFEDSEIGEVPRGWSVSEIGRVVTVAGGSTPSTTEPRFWDGAIHWATPKDMAGLTAPVLLDTERKLSEAGLAETTSGLLSTGTVLLSSRAPIGYLAITEVPVAVNQGFITLTCGTNPSNHYMLHWARENHEAILGQANGTTFLEISKGNFRPMKILVPPDRVMDRFTHAARSLHEKVVSNLRQVETLVSTRDTLLPKLLSGEIRVPIEGGP